MSGPKSSRYTLTPEQRRMLAEQRKIERRRAVAVERTRKAQKQLLRIGGMFRVEKQIASELLNRTGNDQRLAELISELETMITPIQSLAARTDFDDVHAAEGTANTVCAGLKDAKKLASRITAIAATNELNLKENLSEAIDQGFFSSFADIREVKADAAASLRAEAAQRLKQIGGIDFLPPSYRNEISRAMARLEGISDEVFLKNFVAVSVMPLIRQANQLIAEYRECQSRFDPLYTEYVALCDLYSYAAQEYVCSRSSIQILEAEIERMKKAAAEDDEQAYISDCLDEVMVEMGYSVLGAREVTKRNGKRFRNELYTYGNGTAVNVTYSSDGRIAMELGGMDTSDRVPTAQEAERLCGCMEQFCDDFQEIEKRLLVKGVVLTDRLSLLPPDAEYAQIINTSDYSMEAEFKSISAKKRRRSVSGQKAFRKE